MTISWQRLLTLFLSTAFIALVASSSIHCASRERIAKRRHASQHSHRPGAGYLKRGGKPYVIAGVTYYPLASAYGYTKVGTASWYGKKFHGRPTANGEIYNMRRMTAAHKTLPLGVMVEVTKLDTGKKIVVRVNDRGPFVADRIIDLSRAAARRLGMLETGTARVRVVALAKGRPGPAGQPVAQGAVPDFNHGRFWVQVGAFGVESNAARARQRLHFPKGMVTFSTVIAGAGAKLVRVRVGPFGMMELADKALRDVVEQGFTGSFIVAD